MKLSIIIPCYNAEPYIHELIKVLEPQIWEGVEVLIIDDGSRHPLKTDSTKVKIIRQKNKGCSAARNAGIDKAKGDYISFIDADDVVSREFVSKILEKTKDEPDVIELSWKSLTDKNWNIDRKLNSDQDRLPNPSVCTRVFRRSFIGDVRFNTQKDSTEDEDFSRKIGILDPENNYKRAVITDYMYFYRDDVPLSKTKRYAQGLMRTKRVVYYYDQVTSDMTDLLEEIKKEDEINEVFLQTNRCDIPELKRYCQIVKPRNDWGHIIRGEACDHLTRREPPLRTQIVIYRRIINDIGGLMTFILNYVDQMGQDYDITILAENVAQNRMLQLLPKVRVMATKDKPIVCDSLIMLSFLDRLPKNVTAEKVIRMCHACKTDPSWHIPEDYDELVYVSDTAKETFCDTDHITVHNFNTDTSRDMLMLVSATRLPAPDKGDIENRMRKLAKMLNDADIPFIWLNYSDGHLDKAPANFYNMGISYDMQSIIKKADYCVSLSDSECWSYTVLESLMCGTPMICTPFKSAFEMGIEDGVNAHVIPFDMDFDVNILKNIPKFKYKYDNDKIKKQWQQLLGDPKPYERYNPQKMVMVKAKQQYWDIMLLRDIKNGETLIVTEQRANDLINKGLVYKS